MFEPNTYTITYNLDGGTAGDKQPVSGTYDSVFEVSAPTKEGYTFTGWTLAGTNPDYTTAKYGKSGDPVDTSIAADTKCVGTDASSSVWFKNLSTTADGSVTLTATWSTNDYDITVDPAIQHGTVTWAEVPSNSQYGKTIQITAEPATGYQLKTDSLIVYKTGEQATKVTVTNNQFTMPAYGVTITAVFEPNTYTITYNLDGGTAGDKQPVSGTYDSVFEVSAPTKEGYTFTGWTLAGTNPDYTTAKYGKSGDPVDTSIAADTKCIGTDASSSVWFKNLSTTADGSVTLTATWSTNDYTITVDPDIQHGTVTWAEVPSNSQYGKTIQITAEPATGYQLKTDSLIVYKTGEQATKVTVTNNQFTVPAFGVTITAVFEPQTYTITYKDQGDATYSGNNKSSLIKTHVYDTATTLVAGTKTGYTFGGWFTDSGCTGVSVTTIGATDYTADFTLYAKWTADIPPYTITINGNGGTVSKSAIQAYYGEAVSLSSVIATSPAGHTHSGWALSSDGPAVYAAKQSVKDLGNITLYAVWTPAAKQHTLMVKVTSGNGLVSEATVKLRQGNTVWGDVKTTGNEGTVTFYNVPEGVYTVEASNSEKTKTKAVTIPVETNQITIYLPTEKVSSIVDVKSDAGTPAVAVEGADKVAEAQPLEDNQSVTVIVIVESKTDGSAPETQKEIDAIKDITPAGSKVEYLGITIEKKTETTGGSSTTEPIKDTGNNVLEFLIPYDFTNKTKINLYRCHEEADGKLVATPLTKLSARPDVLVDKTYWLDTDNDLIHLYSTKFSTYSVGYFDGSERPSSHSTPSGSSTWIQEPVPAADEKITSTDVTAAYTGIVFIPATTVELRQIEAVNPAYAELISASLKAAENDGVPLTNSKGAKVIIIAPDEIPGIQKEVFAQIIDVESADGSKVTSVPFKVRLSDLAAKNLTTDDVTLYHYLEEYGLWIPLETVLVSTDDVYAYYEAATDGASPFGVLLKKLDAPEVNPVPTKAGKTPVPFMGVIAGLGAAAVVFGLRRK